MMLNIQELKKHKFIVIGYEHYNPLGVIRSLGESGIKPYVIMLRSKIKVASVSKYIKKIFYTQNNEESLDVLIKYFSDEKNKPFVVPCDDNITELVDKKYEELKKHFYISNAGEANRITKYMNKWEICELARKHGLQFAKSWKVKRGIIPDDLVYPIITKPITSYPNWKADYHICSNDAELQNAYNKIKADDLILQQYIKKENELCIDGVVVNGGNDLFVSIASKYTYILPDYYSMEMKVSNFEDENLYAIFRKIFKDIKYEGIFSAEFMIDKNGNLWFLEVNFRNSTWSYASTKVGMNLPLLWADGMINKKIDNDAKKKIPDDYVAIAEVGDFSQRVRKYKMITPLQWFYGVSKANCRFIWNWKDLRPGILYWIGLILLVIKRKLKDKKSNINFE